MDIAVAGSSGLGTVLGVGVGPTALLTALPASPAAHVMLLTPRHLERRAREQAHVVVATHPTVRVGVLVLDHHALTLTLIGAAVQALRDTQDGWSEPGAAVQLVGQAAARSRSIVWHPRVLRLRRPVPSLAQSAASLVRSGGYFVELGSDSGPSRGPGGFAPDGDEQLYAAEDVPALLRKQLGDNEPRLVSVGAETDAPYRTRRSVELCGLAGPSWPPLSQDDCEICGAARPLTGCLFCGTGSSPRPPAGLSAPAAVPADLTA
ncbi:hypothetical protein GCM10022204_27420 [Microlunatus aurantiacus]|uniref:Uncharacterized protein n=1 Tax=Microlunatus aurantiacus TaxID=446786 RepID=A0ABP7DR10_9ACTN